jgi:hypothetical protein
MSTQVGRIHHTILRANDLMSVFITPRDAKGSEIRAPSAADYLIGVSGPQGSTMNVPERLWSQSDTFASPPRLLRYQQQLQVLVVFTRFASMKPNVHRKVQCFVNRRDTHSILWQSK